MENYLAEFRGGNPAARPVTYPDFYKTHFVDLVSDKLFSAIFWQKIIYLFGSGLSRLGVRNVKKFSVLNSYTG